MTRSVRFERLIEMVDGDQAFLQQLVEEGVIVEREGGFSATDVDRVLVSRTLIRELEVNWAGVDIILRLREQLGAARRRLAELEGDGDATSTGDAENEGDGDATSTGDDT